MSATWHAEEDQVIPPLDWPGRMRLALRIGPIAMVTFGGLGVLLVLRLIEAPFFGARRPLTPFITQGVCRCNLTLLGIRVEKSGEPMKHAKGAMVANHVSWLDIFGLNALDRIYFVAKSEVAGWPGIGWLARATGTVFVERKSSAAHQQKTQFTKRLEYGHKLLFFPEGTSTDGHRVLPFKSTLFAAFFDDAHADEAHLQPVTQIYTSPKGRDEKFFGWWGSADFGPHFLAVLAAPGGGQLKVIFHTPVAVAEASDRKDLAKRLEFAVRSGMDQARAEA